jgi:hypothetical protein
VNILICYVFLHNIIAKHGYMSVHIMRETTISIEFEDYYLKEEFFIFQFSIFE